MARRALVPLLALIPALGVTVALAMWSDVGEPAGEAAPVALAADPTATWSTALSLTPAARPGAWSDRPEAPGPRPSKRAADPETLLTGPVARPHAYPSVRVDTLPADSLVRPIRHREALPDTIGVLLDRRFKARRGEIPIENYLVWLPPGLERGDRRWPVILYLHGRSLRGDDTSLLLRYGLPRYLAEGQGVPFIVVAPQLPMGHSWTDADRLAALLDEIEARYPVDRDRVYLTGYSMGGGGVWRMAFRHADRFAAAVPLAAHTPPPSAERSRALRRLPMLVFHGTADDQAPLGAAKVMVEALRAIDADVELRLVEGAGHGDLTGLYRDPALYAWLLEHRRSR